MLDLDRRLRRLERPAGAHAGYEVIFVAEGETLEGAWSRQNPGAPLPTTPVVVLHWEGSQEPTTEEWAAWSRGGEDHKIVASTRARARPGRGGGDDCA